MAGRGRLTGNPDTTSAPLSRGKEAADDGAWIDEKAQEASGVSSGPRSSEISHSKHLEFGGDAHRLLSMRDRRMAELNSELPDHSVVGMILSPKLDCFWIARLNRPTF